MIYKLENILSLRQILILATCMFINVSCANLNTADSPNESVIIHAMTGIWKFEKAIYTFEMNGSEITEEIETFFVDTLVLREDMTYRMAIKDSQSGKMDSDSGEWELTENGNTLLLKNRSTTVVKSENLMDVALPFTFLKKNKLQIYFQVNTPGQNDQRTPVIFKKLK